ncbi:sensor histidine kinase [Gracilibacillus boraciitolerans JCM 21714]|uniref:histidine kinase n=1 Tax=Gracilibacillus boraciitolerans JCM 21714 TaxID=1298598 RepID=W4VP53_9BACI|nr:HAMP domain-containing sensor histidine kinase [Gracilibacillus boraciitolerans]GAE94936.1 sensor histidine kinase [Gracilibacillus boraciitolerans JCM 21714]
MIITLSVIILVLLLLLFQQQLSKQRLDKNLRYITKKIHQLISKKSSDRILLMTENKLEQQLLIEINQLLNYHQESLADSARMRISMKRMLTNISHDLKTPLTIILGYVENLQHNSYTAKEQADLLAKVSEKVMDATRLINKFFDLAKLESGDWQLERKRIHINEICRKVVLGYYDTLMSKGFDVEIDIAKEPLYFYGDEEALNRILHNLLSNAIHYGKDGNFVGLTVFQHNESIMIEVTNKGKGIPHSDQDRIFDRLYTVKESKSEFTQGSGLGLTISKRLTEQLDGQIKFSSIPHRLTTFTLMFKKA